MLLLAHGLAWRWMTGALAEGFTDWTTMRRAQGWQVDHGLPRRDGWPFAARLSVPGLTVSGRSALLPEGFVLESPGLVLEIAPPRLDRLVLRAQGEQRIRLGQVEIPLAADRLEVLLALEPGLPPRALDGLAEGLRAATPEGPLASRRIALSARTAAAEAEPAVTLDLLAEGVLLPPGTALPAQAAFGRHLEEARLRAALTGPLVLHGPAMAAATAWRDAGGVLDLQRVALRWGALTGEARMALTLDPTLQPAGTGLLRLADAPAALEAMAAAGVIPRNAARAAQGVALLTARVPEGGGPPWVELPLTLGNGTLAAARIPLLRLAPIAWPGPLPQRAPSSVR